MDVRFRCLDHPRPLKPFPVPRRSAVNYRGPNGFELAVQKADAYCDEHYGNSDVRLIKDDPRAGRATFACVD